MIRDSFLKQVILPVFGFYLVLPLTVAALLLGAAPLMAEGFEEFGWKFKNDPTGIWAARCKPGKMSTSDAQLCSIQLMAEKIASNQQQNNTDNKFINAILDRLAQLESRILTLEAQ